MTPQSLLREALACVRSQVVGTIVTVALVAGVIVAVILTAGRSVGSQQEVLRTINSPSSRAIVVHDEGGAGLTTAALSRISTLQGVEWLGAFSPAVDAANSNIVGGGVVPARFAYGPQLGWLGISTTESAVYASPSALEQLGMAENAGSVTLTDGSTYGIDGLIRVPDFLQGFEPMLLATDGDQQTSEDQPVAAIVVVASTPELVEPLARQVAALLSVVDTSKLSIQTSQALADLHALVQDQLNGFSNSLVLVVLAITGALLALVLSGLILLRRKDFGRRRALGATRGIIVLLILTQTALVAAAGVVTGVSVALCILAAGHDPLPGATYIAALGLVTLSTAVVAAVVPGTLASLRDPVRELRLA